MTRPLTEFFKTHGWCQRAYARDASDRRESWNSARATSFCLVGAAWRSGATEPRGLAMRLGFVDCAAMVRWNDTPGRTKEEVMQRIAEAGL